MIQLDYLLIIGILLSVLLFLLVGVFHYSKSKLLKGLNIWFLIILSVLLSYLLYPLYELTDYREEFTTLVIIAAIIIKIIINLSIFMIADKIRTKWISKLILILWV
ncbi:MAG: phosphatase, partial [Veillonella parvula]